MNKTLKNRHYAVEIKAEGAEVTSFKRLDDGCEYIWNGNPDYWAGHSPVLFPIVCAARNGEIKVDGKPYKIGNHGFARKSMFTLVEESDTKAVYKLTHSENTLSMYPFKFNFYISYTLEENRLCIGFKVENTDDRTIYFQLGTHPGFNCPLDGGTAFEDYYLEFEKAEDLERLFLNSSNLVISGKSEKVWLEEGRILPLRHELFNEGAIVSRNLNSRKASLKNTKTDKAVMLSYGDLPHMGIWQPRNAPFICIEPWHGLADTDDFNGELKEKELAISLEPASAYQCGYTIEVF